MTIATFDDAVKAYSNDDHATALDIFNLYVSAPKNDPKKLKGARFCMVESVDKLANADERVIIDIMENWPQPYFRALGLYGTAIMAKNDEFYKLSRDYARNSRMTIKLKNLEFPELDTRIEELLEYLSHKLSDS